MGRGAHRAGAKLIPAWHALLAALACAAGTGDHAYITPWFRTERLKPAFEVPDLLRFGPTASAEVLRDGAWVRVFAGDHLQAAALEGGEAVLIRNTAEIHRRDKREVTRLPREAWEPWWPGIVVVPRGLERVVTVKASAERGCGQLVVTQFDTAGRSLRRDVLGAPAVCSFVKGNKDYATFGLGGLAVDGDPVVAVQVGWDGKRPRYLVFRLAPGGPVELGGYTPVFEREEVNRKTWPASIAEVVAFPAG